MQQAEPPHQAINGMLPPSLTTLFIRVEGVTDDPPYQGDAVVRGVQQLLINTAATVPTLTYLKLYMSEREVELDYTRLRNLTNLEDLWLSLPLSAAVEAMSTVKRLPMLQSLQIEVFEEYDPPPACTSILRSLCSSPTPTRLKALALD